MARGSRMSFSDMTAGSRATARSLAAMDAQELNRVGLEMTAGSRTTAGVCAAMDSRELLVNLSS